MLAGYGDGCGVTGRIQHTGTSYFYHRIYGLRAVGRYFILAILKIVGDETGLLTLGDMMNTERLCQ